MAGIRFTDEQIEQEARELGFTLPLTTEQERDVKRRIAQRLADEKRQRKTETDDEPVHITVTVEVALDDGTRLSINSNRVPLPKTTTK